MYGRFDLIGSNSSSWPNDSKFWVNDNTIFGILKSTLTSHRRRCLNFEKIDWLDVSNKSLESGGVGEVLDEYTAYQSGLSIDESTRTIRTAQTLYPEAVDPLALLAWDGPRPDGVLQTEVAENFLERQHWQVVQLHFGLSAQFLERWVSVADSSWSFILTSTCSLQIWFRLKFDSAGLLLRLELSESWI